MSTNITIYSSNYHHGDKSDGVTSDDLQSYVSNSYADALGFVFDYVKQRLLHSCPDLFKSEVLDDESMSTKSLKVVLDDASLDQQEQFCDWYFDIENESDTTACYYVKAHNVTV